jgi:hypothetical protein
MAPTTNLALFQWYSPHRELERRRGEKGVMGSMVSISKLRLVVWWRLRMVHYMTSPEKVMVKVWPFS